LGNPVALMLTPGQAQDLTCAEQLIDSVDLDALLGDKAYDADRLIDTLTQRGIRNRPDANISSFIEHDGKRFLRTGDLGYRDAEGYFFAVDRLKRMINVWLLGLAGRGGSDDA
jgi:acyl-CoA synthetase (AMP-forming)/AMP-acid ligase II